MNLLTWNCRGAGSRGFSSLMNDLIKEYNIGMLCLMETHISGEKALRVINRISLDKSFLVHANGQAGGLWCLWDSRQWHLDILENNSQFIHLKILNGEKPWYCTLVYASPQPQGRISLWNDLSRIGNLIDGPWNLIGDFNAVLRPYERSGGSVSASLRGDTAFREFVNKCQLLDIGYNGAPFTWRRGPVFERLDRSLASFDWRILFPEASLTHLNPLKSDHAPILVKFSSGCYVRSGRRPFRFEAAWLTHDSFSAFLKKQWNTHYNWSLRIDHTKGALKEWNKATFGNIFHAKHRLLRRLNGIARELLKGPNHYLERLQAELWTSLDRILVQEEIFWLQKSRCKM
ncbi:uncharacterized protein LOC109788639 [Cajanus cajan]|uniref:uncharacterized protein LOC109788639 n=1 Tax=Cajanus cajan TaxID=3821 RepID=UPI00098D93E0|nr:uncharacterized protein LOC109788639 [Cajanus cajan]